MTREELQQLRMQHVVIFKKTHPMLPQEQRIEALCSYCTTHFPCTVIKLIDIIEGVQTIPPGIVIKLDTSLPPGRIEVEYPDGRREKFYDGRFIDDNTQWPDKRYRG